MLPPAAKGFCVEAGAAVAWPVVEVAPDARIVAANPAFAAALEQPLSHLVGSSLIDRLWPSDRDTGWMLLAGKLNSATVRFVVEATGVRTLALTVERQPAGTALIVAHDVSHLVDAAAAARRVEIDTALRDSERRFRDFCEASSDQWWEMDAGFRFTYMSRNTIAVMGARSEDLVGRHLSSIGADDEAWRAHFATLKAQLPFRDFVYKLSLGGADERWIKVSGKPIFDQRGDFTGYRGVATDVTARIAAEAQAGRLRDRLLRAIEIIGHPIVIIDGDDRVVVANRAYRDLHRGRDGRTIARPGISSDDLLKWRLDTGFYHVPNGDLGAIEEKVRRWRKDPTSVVFRLGTGRDMMAASHPLPNGDRTVVWTDVTALRQAEEQRRQLETQLHHKQRIEALGTLAGGIAHDLNNTLVPVMALSKVLANRLHGDDGSLEQLDLIHQAAARARDLVKQILAFSRKETPEMRRMDLADLTLKTLTLMRASLPSTIKLTRSIQAVPPISGDPGQLHQVLVNLVTNGAHAVGAATGTVNVALAAEEGWVRLSVEDTGGGMSEDVLARIFEPFFTTKEAGEGSGLGLSVVHGIVASHHGTIAVASEPGRGTRFDIRLPAAQPGGVDLRPP